MRVLIIEDSEYKIEDLQMLLSDMKLDSDVRVAKSFQSGKHALKEFRPELVLLDMTLLTFENEQGQLEGRNRLLGGKEVLAEMQFLGIKGKVIIVTQYDHFGEPPHAIDLQTLFCQLKEKYEALFFGGVYYSNVDSSWRGNLRSLIRAAVSH